jgi:hypothetical protein
MSWLSSFLHPEKGYKSAQEQLDKYYQQANGVLQPYNQNGQESYGKINGAMDKLLNPGALQDEWSKGYQESDIAKQNEAMGTQHGLNAASSMGLMGSSPALQAIQSGTAGIVAGDRQKYLDDLMQKYMAGIGIGQDIYGKGAGAAGQQSTNSMNMGQNSAQNQFNQTNAPGNLFGNLLGTGIGLAGSALGGPIGGALGAGLAQKMGWSTTGSYNPTGGK